MSEMVEKVVKALCVADGFDPDGLIAYARAGQEVAKAELAKYEARARAAIAAMREPTEAMVDAYSMNPSHRASAFSAWTAMIDAALKP